MFQLDVNRFFPALMVAIEDELHIYKEVRELCWQLLLLPGSCEVLIVDQPVSFISVLPCVVAILACVLLSLLFVVFACPSGRVGSPSDLHGTVFMSRLVQCNSLVSSCFALAVVAAAQLARGQQTHGGGGQGGALLHVRRCACLFAVLHSRERTCIVR